MDFEFFRQLAANNNREWFQAHKGEYEAIRAAWMAGMERVQARLAEEWPELGAHGSPKTFRIYRDVRFSHNKTPYKTHIGSVIAPKYGDFHTSGFYLQAGYPEADTGVWGGIWQPESAVLKKLRKAIVDNSEEWLEIVNNPALTRVYKEWFGERLKTAPKGYSPDDPMIEYLRLKDIGKFALLPNSFFADDSTWPDRLADLMKPLIPMLKWLDYSINE